jgi:hypothetical protein
MEAIDVTAEFDSQGRVTPLSFKWREHNFTITSTGRQWYAEDGHHILVMAVGDKVFHLCFVRDKGYWYLIPPAGYGTNLMA